MIAVTLTPDLDAGIADDGRAAERRDVVAWLRDLAAQDDEVPQASASPTINLLARVTVDAGRTALGLAADRIERGEHRRPR